jgi:hypothetical protein
MISTDRSHRLAPRTTTGRWIGYRIALLQALRDRGGNRQHNTEPAVAA